ncbi:MAG: FAD-binding oxidoreductase [Nitriliruptorales bacterium]|nr:FAD-binding oxidoreductase [Nitriliruptorales bacterium]
MTQATNLDAGLATLATRLDGDVIRPADPTYDAHRAVWNGSISRRPAGIARCATPADVVESIRFARAAMLEVAVRSGGHSFPGLSVVDDGLVVDLGLMKDVRADPSSRTARVQAGVLLGEMDHATQAHGFAVPTGAVTHTGVAGLTLGGGIGWLMRRHGLSIDQLRSVDLVTADGSVLTASSERNPELFWGMRGAGANFGVATEFEFSLNEVGPAVVSGLVFWALEDAEDVSRYYREWAAAAPGALTTALIFRRAPALDIVPEKLHGELVVAVVGCWAGDLEEGEQYWAPLRAFGRPVADLTERRRHVEHQAILDPGFPHGVWVYMKACDVPDLTDDIIAACLEHAEDLASPRSSVIAWQLGGAVADVDADETAFAGRDAGFIFNISGITDGPEGFDRERDWVRAHHASLEPHQTSVYSNFLMDADTEDVRAAYGSERFERLQALKRAYDPDNVFHLNQNIPPA